MACRCVHFSVKQIFVTRQSTFTACGPSLANFVDLHCQKQFKRDFHSGTQPIIMNRKHESQTDIPIKTPKLHVEASQMHPATSSPKRQSQNDFFSTSSLIHYTIISAREPRIQGTINREQDSSMWSSSQDQTLRQNPHVHHKSCIQLVRYS
jgi:hypothetical protein